MSILDSMSESSGEAITELYRQEETLRAVYDRLSALWKLYPSQQMVYSLDELLGVWEQVKQWRQELETWAENMGEEA